MNTPTLIRQIAALLDSTLPDEAAQDHQLVEAARVALAAYAPRDFHETCLATEAIALRAVFLDTCRRALDPDLPASLAARLHRDIAALSRDLKETIATLERRQQSPAVQDPMQQNIQPKNIQPGIPTADYGPEIAVSPSPMHQNTHPADLASTPRPEAAPGNAAPGNAAQKNRSPRTQPVQNPMHLSQPPALRLVKPPRRKNPMHQDTAARHQSYDALARFVSQPLPPNQSPHDAWTRAAADAGEATVELTVIETAPAR